MISDLHLLQPHRSSSPSSADNKAPNEADTTAHILRAVAASLHPLYTTLAQFLSQREEGETEPER